MSGDHLAQGADYALSAARLLEGLALCVLCASIVLELQPWARPPILPRALRTMILALVLAPVALALPSPVSAEAYLVCGLASTALGLLVRTPFLSGETVISGMNDAARPLAVSSGTDVPAQTLQLMLYVALWPLLLRASAELSATFPPLLQHRGETDTNEAVGAIFASAQQHFDAGLMMGFQLLASFLAWVLVLELAAGLLQRAMPSLPVLFMLMPLRMFLLMAALMAALPQVIEVMAGV